MTAPLQPASWWRQVGLVLRKEWALEARTGEVTVPTAFFAVLAVVLSSMAYFGGPRTGKIVASGAIWLSVAYASVLSLGKSWARERAGGALDGILLTPLRPSALFVGKALMLTLFLLGVEVVVIPVSALFFSLDLGRYFVGLAIFALLMTPGLAGVGTLFGALLVRTRARDLALSVVVFPLLGPALLTVVAGSRALLGGAELGELGGYWTLLIVFDLVFWLGGFGLFGVLLEE